MREVTAKSRKSRDQLYKTCEWENVEGTTNYKCMYTQSRTEIERKKTVSFCLFLATHASRWSFCDSLQKNEERESEAKKQQQQKKLYRNEKKKHADLNTINVNNEKQNLVQWNSNYYEYTRNFFVHSLSSVHVLVFRLVCFSLSLRLLLFFYFFLCWNAVQRKTAVWWLCSTKHTTAV